MTKLYTYVLLLWCILSLPAFGQQAEIVKGQLYLKLKAESTHRATNNLQLTNIPNLTGYEPMRKLSKTKRQAPSVLDGLYKVEVDQHTDIQSLCDELSRYANVVYAQPIYLEELLFIPNDPAITAGSQGYLDVIQAFDAWDIDTGDSTIVIGISDTGINLNHDDLRDKIYTNHNDPYNGIDDDNNGYIDDYQGYDFADGDSLALAETSQHGSRVAGIAGANTNNGIGIAGVGYQCKISSLKIFKNDANTSTNAYESIIYAADNGYDVINLSWGSANTYNPAAQDIINYAAVEHDVVIVAAAGNTSTDVPYYPASYDNVLSVAATNLNDAKASFSSYHYNVDITAPGNAIYSTDANNSYGSDNGTSYSSPMVAGAAGLLRNLEPTLRARQVLERLRVTSDKIYDVSSNSQFVDKLGYGRLNIKRAIEASGDTLKSIRIAEYSYSNGLTDKLYYGDSIEITLKLINYLGTSNARVSLSSSSEYFIVDDESSMQLPTLGTLDTLAITIKKCRLSDDTPTDLTIPIRVTFEDGNYQDFEYIEIQTEPDQVRLDNGNLTLTIGGDGDLGYTNDHFLGGSGLIWQGETLANRINFFVALDSQQVSDNFYTEILGTSRKKDFIVNRPSKLIAHETVDFLAISTFSDDSASSPGNLQITQQTITNLQADYLIQEYYIGNRSASNYELSNGMYIDWGLDAARDNRSFYQDSIHAIISFSSDSSLFVGITSYYDTLPIHQSLDQDSWNNNSPDIEGEWTDSLIFSLATQSQFDSAGWLNAGNDIASLLADDSISLAAGGFSKVAYLIAFGVTYDDLVAALDSARSTYESYLSTPILMEEFVSCEGAALAIDLNSGDEFAFFSDPLGTNQIATGDTLQTGPISQDTSFYARNLDGLYPGDLFRFDVKLVNQVAQFQMSTDTLLLDLPVNNVTFTDQSFRPTSWHWDFDNGTQATVQNPTVSFSEEGTYQISLTVSNELGCSETFSRELLVASRSPEPDVQDTRICAGEDLMLEATNTDSLAVYLYEADESPSLIVNTLEIQNLQHDTTLYLTNLAGEFESLKKEVNIMVQTYEASFQIIPDTSTVETAALLINTSPDLQSSNWTIEGDNAGTNDSISIPITGSTLDVSLTATSTLGCVATSSEVISFVPSPLPTIAEMVTCFGTDITISPANGKVFAFYAESSLTNLLHKGSALTIDSLVTESTLYITGLDSILPSAPVELNLTPQKPDVNISAAPDTLYLDEQQTVTFTAQGETIHTTRWYRDGTYYDNSESIIAFFDQERNYELILHVTDRDACSNSDTLNYPVYNSRPTTPLSSAQNSELIYPNPTHGAINIDLTGDFFIRILDLTGKELLHTTGSPYMYLKLPKGTYFVEIEIQSTTIHRKLIIE